MAKKAETLEVTPVDLRRVIMHIVGTSPLILNRMSEKVRNGLLVGTAKKTSAEKAGVAKHNPLQEYRASVYKNLQGETAIGMPSTAFKAAMETAALETPGAKKAQIGRLVSVPWFNVPVYGEPQIFSTVTRSADMNKTPDVRTRAIIPKWAAVIDISYVAPTITIPMIMTLLTNAGIVSGVGDFRQEKGAGSFGRFKIVEADDAEFLKIVAEGGKEVQESALDHPTPFDDETAALLEFFDSEVNRRGLRVVA